MNRAHKTLAGEEGSFRFGIEYRNHDATNRAGITDQYPDLSSDRINYFVQYAG